MGNLQVRFLEGWAPAMAPGHSTTLEPPIRSWSLAFGLSWFMVKVRTWIILGSQEAFTSVILRTTQNGPRKAPCPLQQLSRHCRSRNLYDSRRAALHHRARDHWKRRQNALGGLRHWSIASQTLLVLHQLLVVLMLVEILHTVRISIHSHYLVTEPFLVVGLIASIRRILVITLEAATLTQGGTWSTEGVSIFRANMLELGLLGVLILILVFSITLLRRYAPSAERLES